MNVAIDTKERCSVIPGRTGPAYLGLSLSGPQFPPLYSVNTVELDGFLFPAAHTSWDPENIQLSPCGR